MIWIQIAALVFQLIKLILQFRDAEERSELSAELTRFAIEARRKRDIAPLKHFRVRLRERLRERLKGL